LPSVKLNGHNFHAETFGDPSNPVLIAVHGGPGGDYRSLLSLQALSDRYFVVFYDQRMSGLSSRETDKEIVVRTFMDDLNFFVDHYANGRKVNIVGHSWGAMLASGYVGQYPEKVSKVVLVEPGILRPDLSMRYFQGPSNSAPWHDRLGHTIWDSINFGLIWLNKWRVDTTNDPQARDDYFVSMLALYNANVRKETPNEFVGWRMGTYVIAQTVQKMASEPALLESLNFLQGVDRFTGDVLFLSSEYNDWYGADYQRQHLQYYRNATEDIVAGSGHLVIFIDQPELSNKMIDAFL
jgi:proline iminopeptidase